jgi:hypothetical protein
MPSETPDPPKVKQIWMVTGPVVVVSMFLTWFLIPHTSTGGVNSITSKVGLKYFGAGLVGFFELLAYSIIKESPKIAVLGTVIGTVGSVILFVT